jgi:hypothetical protein
MSWKEGLGGMLQGRCQGQGLSEYGLVMALVCIACIGGLILLSKGVNTSLSSMVPAREAPRIANMPQSDLPTAPQSGGTLSPQNSGLFQLPAQSIQLLHMNLSAQIQTAGANGTTEVYAQQLQYLANKLLHENQISQEQYSQLMALSNQGYRLAAIEKVMEDAVREANGDFSKLEDQKFMFEGKSYTIPDLYEMVGFQNGAPDNPLSTSSLSRAGSELASFLTLYDSINKTGLLSTNPEARGTVNTAALMITSIAESVQHSLHKYWYLPMTEPLTSETLANEAGEEASEITSDHSKKICKAGNYTANGVTCSL